ncbi:hypothetical protein [Tepidanaerobacter acetatoxydans]|uniref:hypothetical protein n=1 Tax=Tepidanaerobacter acetatoxydans TaxID=499229 RepID=UPI001BD23718|nr:hypothetical protein [Tepidanaerobacter acetatoxydans]
MNSENEMLDLMTKLYAEMQQGFNQVHFEMQKGFSETNERIDKVESRLSKVDGRLSKVENSLGKVENRLGKVEAKIDGEISDKLSALFDGYKQNSEKLDRIEKEVSKHEEVILRRIR